MYAAFKSEKGWVFVHDVEEITVCTDKGLSIEPTGDDAWAQGFRIEERKEEG